MTILYEYKCPRCGTPLSASQSESCQNCGAQFVVPSEQVEKIESQPDPDRPAWGVGAALGLWLFSVFVIVLAGIGSMLFWVLWRRMQGISFNEDELKRMLNDPNYILVFLLITFGAQIITLLAAYKLVVISSGQSFFAALGWRWHPNIKELLLTALFTIFVFILAFVLASSIPNKETDLDRLIKASPLHARLFIVALAVISAPLIEEVVYRGVLYSALRKRLGIWPAILVVSLIFVGVHIVQYWGGWGVLAALSILSLGITIVRAYTGSLLPCYIIHLLFNSLGSIGIIFEGLRK